jgi:hypothetical protein
MKTFLAVVLLSCVAFSQDEVAITKAKAACGPDDVSFSVKTSEGSHPAATVEPGKALVYVVGQDPACSSCGKVARIGLDGAWAGAIDLAPIRSSPLNRASIIYAPTGNRSLPAARSP